MFNSLKIGDKFSSWFYRERCTKILYQCKGLCNCVILELLSERKNGSFWTLTTTKSESLSNILQICGIVVERFWEDL